MCPNKYRASETMPEWFAKQTPEVQAAFYNAEKAIDEVLESFSEMMGLKKNSCLIPVNVIINWIKHMYALK